jgi:undecaprenyl phosphate N,N'-diacetylbacillosamine 1-phosphate transferase
MQMKIYTNVFKRIIDFILAFIGLLLLSPIFVITLIVLFFSNRGKPFFYQMRPGKNEKIFRIIKFKTMNDKKDQYGEFLPFEQRVTKIGAFVRKYSLDETPQLFNVLKGDMSLIGPRPLMVEYLAVYQPWQKERHLVKPGISGWAQVNGRNSITWRQKFEYDVWYVKNISFLLDLKILFLTVKKVIIKDGINSKENLMFMGTDNE